VKRVPICFMFLLVVTAYVAAQNSECAKVERNGDTITVVTDSIRPLDSIANALSQRFNVSVSAEEPESQSPEDFVDVAKADPQWSSEHQTAHYQVPKRRHIEARFPAARIGHPLDVRAALQQVVESANRETPFGYRLDSDGEFFSFVPTTTSSANGEVMSVTPLLDRKVTIPPGSRRIIESAEVLADSLSRQTGLRVSCCQSLVAGVVWGTAIVPFEAHDEPARKVLVRLIKANQLSEERSSSRSLVGWNRWSLRCDDGWCFINLSSFDGGGCRLIVDESRSRQ
jgi:hypothetical protein